jgi:hypothetical protein
MKLGEEKVGVRSIIHRSSTPVVISRTPAFSSRVLRQL